MREKARPGVPKAGDKVLWIRFNAYGDVLEAAADARNFKRRFPYTHLTFLSRSELAELLRSQPYIDDVLAGGKKSFAELRRAVQNIRAGHYEWLISDQHGGKSALMALFSRAKHRIGSSYLPFFKYIYHISLDLWSINCDINIKDRSQPTIFTSAEDMEAALALLARLPERRLFAVIGSSRVGKMWTEKGWIDFLRPLVNEGWGVVLNGHGPVEEALGRKIENSLASGNVLNLVGALNFKKMAGVALQCSLAIGNDTGPLHLAALGGIPTMGLFNYPAKGTALDLMNIPWFRELRAWDYVKNKSAPPLKNLPAEPVAKAFDSFAAEFLPKALRQG